MRAWSWEGAVLPWGYLASHCPPLLCTDQECLLGAWSAIQWHSHASQDRGKQPVSLQDSQVTRCGAGKDDTFGMRQLAQPAKLHRDSSAFRRGREKCCDLYGNCQGEAPCTPRRREEREGSIKPRKHSQENTWGETHNKGRNKGGRGEARPTAAEGGKQRAQGWCPRRLRL